MTNGKILKQTGSNTVQLTSGDEVDIDVANSGFSVIGAEADDNQQPLVTIRLNGKITYQGKSTPFSIQTSVSQRDILN